jgi:hypothetical protein
VEVGVRIRLVFGVAEVTGQFANAGDGKLETGFGEAYRVGAGEGGR